MAEFLMNPDREMVEQALVMGLLVKGRTVLEDFSWTDRSLLFAKTLEEWGLHFEQKGHQLVLEGPGLRYHCPAYLALKPEFGEHALTLLFGLASRDPDTLYTVGGSAESLTLARSILAQRFCIREEKETPDSLIFQFLEKSPEACVSPSGDIPYLLKTAILLQTLVSGRAVSFEERTPVRDQWSEMLVYFGVPMTLDRKNCGEMDELARRMAKARGLRMESKVATRLEETRVLTSHDFFVPGDTTEAAAFAVLGAMTTLPDNGGITLRNVGINTGRAGLFSSLKRMGANVEITSRRERYGSPFGNIEVKSGKRLQARRFAGDSLTSTLEEYPFLALAACGADGESILRVPDHLKDSMKSLFELLAQNLRRTGAEVGVYEEGLVIRGREELDGGAFDCGGDPVVGLMLFVLSLFAKGTSTVEGVACVEETFPGICEKLKMAVSG